MGKKLERASDNLATEQTIMGQPKNQRQDANDDRSTVKDQAMIQVFPRIGCSGFLAGFPFLKYEFPAGQIHRDCQHGEINAGDREP
jgi:hypothetical protein